MNSMILPVVLIFLGFVIFIFIGLPYICMTVIYYTEIKRQIRQLEYKILCKEKKK